MPYARKASRVPRQFVIIGTLYDAEDYLHAPTSNSRFWPVRVKHFDLERLRNARDQLWAEAAEAEALCKSLQINPKLFEAVVIKQEAPLSSTQGRGTKLHASLGRDLRALKIGSDPGSRGSPAELEARGPLSDPVGRHDHAIKRHARVLRQRRVRAG